MKPLFLILFTFSLLTYSSIAAITETNFSPLQIPAVFIGDPENQGDGWIGGRDLGAVAAPFYLGKYEITAGEFCSFLNAVAPKTDTHGLYHPGMSFDTNVACLTCTFLADGTYSYSPISERENIPVTYVSLYTAERYCNWLRNGCPSPANGDDETTLKASTESGAYAFSKEGNREISTFNPGGTNTEGLLYYIPTETEWVKAAYYKGNGSNAGYWKYPTQHDIAPDDGQGDPSNQANYRTMATDWEPRQRDPVLTDADHFDQTFSFYGCRDMGGNAAEWTTSFGEWSSYSDNSTNAIVRGGSWESEYSTFYDNDLMRTSPSECYHPLITTNTIGFRIAVRVPTVSLKDNTGHDQGGMDVSDASGYGSLFLWPLIRQATIGCPTAMAKALLQYFGIVGESLFARSGAIIAVDLMAFAVISLTINTLFDLATHSSSKGIKDTLPTALGSALKSTFGCGMCQLQLLQTVLSRIGVSSSFLKSAEDYFGNLSAFLEMEDTVSAIQVCLPCVSQETIEFWVVRLVPVVPELAIAGAALIAFDYSWPTLDYAATYTWESSIQAWYALKNF